jgi:putative inorganic carbon (hco3(-)) transporter
VSFVRSVRAPGRGDRFYRGEAGVWPLATAGLASAAVLAILVSKVDAFLALGLTVAAMGAMILLLALPFTGVLLGVFVLYSNLPAALAREGMIPEEATALVGIFFVPALIQQLVARRRSLRLDRTFGLMVALLAVMLVSTAVAAVDVGVGLAYIAAYHLGEGMAVFLLVLNTVRDRVALTRVLTVIVAASALVAALSTYQSVTGNVHQEFFGLASRTLEHLEERPELAHRPGMGREDRARGPVDEANRFAQILLVAAAFALARAWTRKGSARAAALGAMCLALVGMFLTYSRGAFVTLILLVLLLGALRIIPRRYLALGVLAGVVLVPVVAPAYVDRLHTIAGARGIVSAEAGVEADGATRGRTTAMLATLTAFSEHPLLGVGPGQYVDYHSVSYQLRPEIAFREIAVPRRAHNLIVEIAAETGVVGLLLFMAIPLLLLRDLWRIRKRAGPDRLDVRRIALGFILAILAYLGTAMFLHLAYHRYYWLLIGLSAAAVWILRAELEADHRSGTEGMEGGTVRSRVKGPVRAATEGWP